MDNKTIQAYNQDAKNIAKLHSTLIPERIYQLIQQFFIKEGDSVDIGCGIGRDTHWLNQQGYPCIGIDASIEMLNEAISLYPSEHFSEDYLPSLKTLPENSFQNILCSAVLMHIPQAKLESACQRLLELLKPNGCLIVSFRATNEPDQRENEKLYDTINTKEFLNFFGSKGCKILLNESETEIKRDLTWHNIVIKK
ncbi:MAG: class I SAM-dependent methyltransferase [Methyloprofundus sp.]|nr:class I SAM-dependent methyltransferase [Methyloprofundus sp.]MDT8426533.1 class I SAM-dependent methyltransferase [Methyloprofundus sp.]